MKLKRTNLIIPVAIIGTLQPASFEMCSARWLIYGLCVLEHLMCYRQVCDVGRWACSILHVVMASVNRESNTSLKPWRSFGERHIQRHSLPSNNCQNYNLNVFLENILPLMKQLICIVHLMWLNKIIFFLNVERFIVDQKLNIRK